MANLISPRNSLLGYLLVLSTSGASACARTDATGTGSATEHGGTGSSTLEGSASDGQPGDETAAPDSGGTWGAETCPEVARPQTGFASTPLGAFAPGDEICFTVPEGLSSFVIVSAGDGGEVEILGLEAPDGTALVEDTQLIGTPLQLNLSGVSFPSDPAEVPNSQALLVPMTTQAPADPPQPGEWRLRLGEGSIPQWDADVVEVEIWARTAGQAETATVEINVFAAPSVANDSDLQGLVEESLGYFPLFVPGDIVVHELGEWAETLDDSDEEELATAATSQVGSVHALNIVATHAIDSGALSVLGASPIVGRPTLPGTPASALLVEVGADTQRSAQILAHEFGHYVGLLHTTEVLLSGSDGLDDTPECPDDVDVANCPDASNLMFAAIGLLEPSPRVLTAQQQRMALGALVYAGETPMVREERRTKPAGARFAPWFTRLSPRSKRWLASMSCRHTGHHGAQSPRPTAVPTSAELQELRAVLDNPALPAHARRVLVHALQRSAPR